MGKEIQKVNRGRQRQTFSKAVNQRPKISSFQHPEVMWKL